MTRVTILGGDQDFTSVTGNAPATELEGTVRTNVYMRISTNADADKYYYTSSIGCRRS